MKAFKRSASWFHLRLRLFFISAQSSSSPTKRKTRCGQKKREKKSYTAHTLCTLNVNFIEKRKKSLNCQWIVTAAAYFSYPLEYERRLSNNREPCVIYESHTDRQRDTHNTQTYRLATYCIVLAPTTTTTERGYIKSQQYV